MCILILGQKIYLKEKQCRTTADDNNSLLNTNTTPNTFFFFFKLQKWLCYNCKEQSGFFHTEHAESGYITCHLLKEETAIVQGTEIKQFCIWFLLVPLATWLFTSLASNNEWKDSKYYSLKVLRFLQ